MGEAQPDPVAGAARADDAAAFAARVERHRRELHVHCYRMLASFDEAEDLVQETFLRAWRARATLEGGPALRAWLYSIATNACLDALRRRSRRVPSSSFAEVPWLQPYPDRLLDEVAPSDAEPDAVLVARETIELTFLAVIQLLPPRQRAVLILRDVLDWSAAETAELLETTVAAANSALQRARATLRDELPERPAEPAPADLSDTERALLDGFIAHHESGDTAAAAALLAEDVRVTMPPFPQVYEGIEAMRPLWRAAFEEGMGDWRLVPTRANRMPAAASYLRAPGDTDYRAFKIDVIRVRHGKIAEVTTFGASLFPQFGLAPAL